jgi:hypothetical protein
MHPDINNFSNILDIDTSARLEVHLVLQIHEQVDYHMQLNDHKIMSLDERIFLDLFSPIKLTCSITDTHKGAVEIKSFTVNNKEILPIYQHLAQPATAWINKKGIWCLNIPAPFYSWYHEISGQGWIA